MRSKTFFADYGDAIGIFRGKSVDEMEVIYLDKTLDLPSFIWKETDCFKDYIESKGISLYPVFTGDTFIIYEVKGKKDAIKVIVKEWEKFKEKILQR